MSYRPAKDKINDQKFIKRLKKKDPEAFDELYELYEPMARMQCHKLLRRNPEAWEDVVQNIFLLIFLKIHQYRGEAPLTSWLYTLSFCEIQMWIRKNIVQKGSLVLCENPDTITDVLDQAHGIRPSNIDDYIDTKNLLKRMNLELATDRRQAIKAEIFIGQKDGPAALGISLPAYKSRLSRGRADLAALYKRVYQEDLDRKQFWASGHRMAGNQ